MQPPHSSYFGTPTFRSTYHFPILPQSRELRDYHQWRRLGDAALLSRQQVKDAEFKRLQEELARPGIAARRQPPRRRSTTQKPKEPTKEPERQPSPQSRSQGRVRRSLGSFSRARKEILNYSGWRETLLLIFLLCTTTLLSPPSSLDPMSRQNTYGSAESIEFQAVTRYELVPEVKQWGKFHYPLTFDL